MFLLQVAQPKPAVQTIQIGGQTVQLRTQAPGIVQAAAVAPEATSTQSVVSLAGGLTTLTGQKVITSALPGQLGTQLTTQVAGLSTQLGAQIGTKLVQAVGPDGQRILLTNPVSSTGTLVRTALGQQVLVRPAQPAVATATAQAAAPVLVSTSPAVSSPVTSPGLITSLISSPTSATPSVAPAAATKYAVTPEVVQQGRISILMSCTNTSMWYHKAVASLSSYI